MKREFFYPSADGETDIHGVEWIPEGEVKAVLPPGLQKKDGM